MTNHTDIVTRLRAVLHQDRSVEIMNREAADEIERLRRGGCARDQTITQFCAEAVTLQQQRDEAFIRANAVIREASALITAKIPAGKASAYWNAVDEFRRFDTKTT